MKLLKRVIIITTSFLVFFVLISFFEMPKQEKTITNTPAAINQSFNFPQTSVMQPQPSTGMQVKKSLLGVEVKFLNGHVDYAGLAIVNDPRYQALTNSEKLVDAIVFQPLQAPPFLVLFAIGKGPNGAPMIIPGKFDIVRKTERNGFVLKDNRGRNFYYSGYIHSTPLWKNLTPGQALQDRFCKVAVQITMCTPNDTVNVILKKPVDYRKDIPFLTLVK